jgi:hypothetical protein
MTIRNLEFLFKPKSIALIGASKRRDPLGAVLAQPAPQRLRRPCHAGQPDVSSADGCSDRVRTSGASGGSACAEKDP